MKTPEMYCARFGAPVVLVLLVTGVCAVTEPAGVDAEYAAPSYDRLAVEVLAADGGKGLDHGLLEWWHDQPQPEAWLYAADSTIDGDGVEYLVFTAAHQHPTLSGGDQAILLRYVAGPPPPDLEAALAWIVATYPHVNDVNELSVHARVVSSVQ